MMKVELVLIEGLYALRRTRSGYFGIRPTVDFLNFNSNTPEWRPRDHGYFSSCLTDDLEKARLRLAFNGSDFGAVCPSGTIPMHELMDMIKLANVDEGMNDLLQKAREFYLLKKKQQ